MTDEASKSPHADAGRLERPVGRLEPERASACGLTECHGKPMCTRCLHIDHRDKAPWPDMPKEPPLGLLMSMAIRFDHGLGVPGYYDSEWFRRPGQPSHKQRVEATLTMMRQLYEEVSGHGFYSTAKEAEYAALADSRPPNVGGEARLAAHQPSQTTTATPQGVASTDQLGGRVRSEKD